jgi:hypothetical protein
MISKDLWGEDMESGAAVPVPETNAETISASNIHPHCE